MLNRVSLLYFINVKSRKFILPFFNIKETKKLSKQCFKLYTQEMIQ